MVREEYTVYYSVPGEPELYPFKVVAENHKEASALVKSIIAGLKEYGVAGPMRIKCSLEVTEVSA